MNDRAERLVKRRVTYTLEHEGKFYIVENVRPVLTRDWRTVFLSCNSRKLQKMVLGPGKPTA